MRIWRPMRPVLLLPLLLSSAACSASVAQTCSQSGFTGSQTCADCDKLREYTKDEGLWAECRECCAEPANDKLMYDRATLKVCKHRLRDFPHIEGFVRQAAADFPQLRVAYEYGRAPTLVLRAGERVDSLRIDNWKTDHIVEFLIERLRKDEPA